MVIAKLELLRLNEQVLDSLRQAKAAGISEEQFQIELDSIEEELDRLYRGNSAIG